ncbi:MAG: helix-turn-helix domain-containing protein, partial [Pigmentiphaga sp.]
LYSIASVFLDLDLFRSDDSRETVEQSEQTVLDILDCAAEAGSPAPRITHSGRGYYLHWMLNAPHLLGWSSGRKRWRVVVQRLMCIFGRFGPDRSVSDPTRILRVPGSLNPKAEPARQLVRVIHHEAAFVSFDSIEAAVAKFDSSTPAPSSVQFKFNNPGPSVRTGQRDLLADKLLNGAVSSRLIDGGVGDNGHKAAQAILVRSHSYDRGVLDDEEVWFHPGAIRLLRDDSARYVGMVHELGDFMQHAFKQAGARHRASGEASAFAGTKTGRRVASDLVLLLQMRGSSLGSRDRFIFWILNYLILGGVTTSESIGEHAARLVQIIAPDDDEFAQSMTTSGFLRTLHSKLLAREAMKRDSREGDEPIYTPQMDHLASIFEVSAIEQAHMRCVIDEHEFRRRRCIRLARKRGKPDGTFLQDLMPDDRRAARECRGKEVVSLHAKGSSAPAIAKLLNVPRSTVYRILKQATEKRQQPTRASLGKNAVVTVTAVRHVASQAPAHVIKVAPWQPGPAKPLGLAPHVLKGRPQGTGSCSGSPSHFGNLTRLEGCTLGRSPARKRSALPPPYRSQVEFRIPGAMPRLRASSSMGPKSDEVAPERLGSERSVPAAQPSASASNSISAGAVVASSSENELPLAGRLVPREFLLEADLVVDNADSGFDRQAAVLKRALSIWHESLERAESMCSARGSDPIDS